MNFIDSIQNSDYPEFSSMLKQELRSRMVNHEIYQNYQNNLNMYKERSEYFRAVPFTHANLSSETNQTLQDDVVDISNSDE